MRRLLTGYAVYYNHRHRRHGHLFQNRYKSILCQEETYLLELVRYIHLNPLRAKVVESLADCDTYPYSGHSVLMGKVQRGFQDTDYVLKRFGRIKNYIFGGRPVRRLFRAPPLPFIPLFIQPVRVF